MLLVLHTLLTQFLNGGQCLPYWRDLKLKYYVIVVIIFR
jgi:hypothetical protein